MYSLRARVRVMCARACARAIKVIYDLRFLRILLNCIEVLYYYVQYARASYACARVVKVIYDLRFLRILLNCIEVLLIILCTNARARVEVKERKRRKEVEVKKKW